jgi:flagellar biogenesis protein FliO
LPTDVLELLGRTPLAARHHLQLIRLGHRLLLVSVSTDAVETLSEITDVDEVNHLAALCKQGDPNSISASFRQVFQQLGSAGQAAPQVAAQGRPTGEP